MFEARTAEELRAMLLHMAAASAGEPTKRARMKRWLKAALELVDDEEIEQGPVIGVTPQQVFALREIADSLGMAAEHADWLADQAQAIRPRFPGR